MFSIRPADHAMEHVRTRTEKLLLNNEIRVMELLESIQYGVLYLIVGFATGVTLDYSFPNYNEQTKTSVLFTEVALQCLLLIILVFYIRKLVKIVPFLFVIDFSGSGKSSYKPYEASEYGGEIIIAIVLLGAQFNLIKKLDLLSRRFYSWLYSEEKAIGESLGI
jgi:hypothetical protein